MFSTDSGLIVWTILALLPPLGVVVGAVFVVRFFVRLSRRVEHLRLSVDRLAESLDKAPDVTQ